MAKKFVSISLPKDLVDKVDLIIKAGTLGYDSRPEFIKEAVRKRLSELGYEAGQVVSPFRVWDIAADRMTIYDEALSRWVNINIREGRLICELDKSEDCIHVKTAAENPQVIDIFRRMNWKLPRR
ncbi:MAG: ribbon-helix-helix protein, CopG family [archaeon]|nr:ribbon-helix-helix protein, CopG family [archaeon]MCP8312840.1 ribbon-helix-helix protein, CopG family [archaeon]MCP8319740.1 ribbon-helix-helix protein, CopG family [archaeon]